MLKLCKRCGKTFACPISKQKFCSQICGAKSTGERRRGFHWPPEMRKRMSEIAKSQNRHPSIECCRKGGLKGGPRKPARWYESMQKRKGANNVRWKGGRWRLSTGYIYILKPEHPHASKAGYVLEHRLIMEQAIGRYLLQEEQVHHINHVKDNNRIENLKLFSSNSEHIKHHFENGDIQHLNWQHPH